MKHEKKKEKFKLIVYSRPHIKRNIYDITTSVIYQAVKEGLFNPEKWEIYGVGSNNSNNVKINDNVMMINMEHLSENEYFDFLIISGISFTSTFFFI